MASSKAQGAAAYPMLQSPSFKDYIWGGDRLAREYGKRAARLPIAESWELSCHPDGPSAIANGPLAGMPLPEALARWPQMAGSRAGIDGPSGFPILVKLIDAKEDLSLQVHPDDAYARAREGSFGKNEVWYVIDCEPGARLALGLLQPVPPELRQGAPSPREELLARISDGSIISLTRFVEVQPGDCFCVRAGLLHAICAGILIAEIQQNSNITYRVNDYGRLGADGKPRPMHIEQAADVIDAGLVATNARDGQKARPVPGGPGGGHAEVFAEGPGGSHAEGFAEGYKETQLTDWPYFRTRRLDIGAGGTAPCARLEATSESFHSILTLDDGLEIHCGALSAPLRLPKGASVFIPAGMGAYAVKGAGRALITDV